ncbi:MAG: hypothetical protein CME64_04135 [Halobacteriovoraceae bacterium]|nr:hypothetical protein [Halobacteriovoraceae bacterium]|tara:strand:+ start:108972 stop:109562 length:591 start_codon:yes stop_codon:yes gene_type:complete
MATIRRVILLSLLISNCFAASAISIEKSTSDGLLQNAFTKNGDTWIFVKNTNFFDKKDTTVGTFKIGNQKALSNAVKELENIENTINKAIAKFPDFGKSQEGVRHETYYKIGKHQIGPKHPLFSKTKQVYEAMVFNSSIKQVTGIKVDLSKAPTLLTLKGGKVIQKKEIPLSFECDQRPNYRFCDFSPHGLIYLEK